MSDTTKYKDAPVLQHPQIKDVQTAIRIYWAHPEIGVHHIKELFGLISNSPAHKYKRAVLNEMAKNDIKTHTRGTINTRFAYTCWGIDIDDLEKRHAKLKKI